MKTALWKNSRSNVRGARFESAIVTDEGKRMNKIIQEFERRACDAQVSGLQSGRHVIVQVKVVEGDRERVQPTRAW